jgi:hypothetical protein
MLWLKREKWWLEMNPRRKDLECLDGRLPDTIPMHRLLSQWLIQDVFSKLHGIAEIREMNLEELPDFLVYAVLEHVAEYFRPIRTITWPQSPDETFLLPGDTAAREQKSQSLDDEAVDHTAMRPYIDIDIYIYIYISLFDGAWGPAQSCTLVYPTHHTLVRICIALPTDHQRARAMFL